MQGYSRKVIDHFRNPRNVGEIKEPNGIGRVGNPLCGDVMVLYLKIEKGVIVDIRFKTFGCCAAIATSSMITELVKGKTIDEALKISNQAVTDALGGLPSIKRHCSVLGEQALRAAIRDYHKKATDGIQDDERLNKMKKNKHYKNQYAAQNKKSLNKSIKNQRDSI